MLRALAASVVISLGITACATVEEIPIGPTVPAEKTTCTELVLTTGDATPVLVDRVLVPYSRTILGVEADYEDDEERTLRLISGGYLDDITEPYDDLSWIGTVELADRTADVLVGEFFGSPITVAYLLGADPPCSTVAVVAVGFSSEEFADLSTKLELREHN